MRLCERAECRTVWSSPAPEPNPFEYDGGYEQAYKEVDPRDEGIDPGHLGGAHGDGAVEPEIRDEIEREIQRGEFDGYRAHGDAWLEE